MENRFVVADKKGYYNIVDNNNKKYLNEKTIYLKPNAELKIIIAIDEENGCSIFNQNGENLLKQYFSYVEYFDMLKLFIITQDVKDSEGKKINRYYKIANKNFDFLFEDIEIIRVYPSVQTNLLIVKAINKDNNEEEFFTIDANHNIKKIIIPEETLLIKERIKFFNDYNAYVYIKKNKVFFSDYANKNQTFIADAESFSVVYCVENDLVKISIQGGDNFYKDNFINITNGKLILEDWYIFAHYYKENNSFLVRKKDKGMKHNIIKDNKIFSEVWLDNIWVERLINNSILYIVYYNNKINFVDENLNFISDIWFDNVEKILRSDFVYKVSVDGEEKLFDIKANDFLKLNYKEIYSLNYFLTGF